MRKEKNGRREKGKEGKEMGSRGGELKGTEWDERENGIRKMRGGKKGAPSCSKGPHFPKKHPRHRSWLNGSQCWLQTCGTMLRMAAVESLPSGASPPGACLLPLRLATWSCSHTNVTRKRKTAVRRQDAVRRRPMAGVAIATRSPRPAVTCHRAPHVYRKVRGHAPTCIMCWWAVRWNFNRKIWQFPFLAAVSTGNPFIVHSCTLLPLSAIL
jgi:hypothetical protein